MRSPLVISYPGMQHRGQSSQAIVDSSRIFATVNELVGLPPINFTHGKSFVNNVKHPKNKGQPVFGYNHKGLTLRNNRYRLIEHIEDGYIELYDHDSSEKESKNIAAQSQDIVNTMLKKLHSFKTERAAGYK